MRGVRGKEQGGGTNAPMFLNHSLKNNIEWVFYGRRNRDRGGAFLGRGDVFRVNYSSLGIRIVRYAVIHLFLLASN
jgi:hypothetical protein